MKLNVLFTAWGYVQAMNSESVRDTYLNSSTHAQADLFTAKIAKQSFEH